MGAVLSWNLVVIYYLIYNLFIELMKYYSLDKNHLLNIHEAPVSCQSTLHMRSGLKILFKNFESWIVRIWKKMLAANYNYNSLVDTIFLGP